MVVHASNPSSPGSTGRQVSEQLRPAWSTYWFPCQPGLGAGGGGCHIHSFIHFLILGFVNSKFFSRSVWLEANQFQWFFFFKNLLLFVLIFFSFCLFSFIAPQSPLLTSTYFVFDLLLFYVLKWRSRSCFYSIVARVYTLDDICSFEFIKACLQLCLLLMDVPRTYERNTCCAAVWGYQSAW